MARKRRNKTRKSTISKYHTRRVLKPVRSVFRIESRLYDGSFDKKRKSVRADRRRRARDDERRRRLFDNLRKKNLVVVGNDNIIRDVIKKQCEKRKSRRRALFSLSRIGKGRNGPKRRNRTVFSDVRC